MVWFLTLTVNFCEIIMRKSVSNCTITLAQVMEIIKYRFDVLISLFCIGIYVTMTVDNRGQDEEEVGNPGTLQRQNSKGDIKELDGGNAMQVIF